MLKRCSIMLEVAGAQRISKANLEMDRQFLTLLEPVEEGVLLLIGFGEIVLKVTA